MPSPARRRVTRRDTRPAIHPQRDGFHEQEGERVAEPAREEIVSRTADSASARAEALRKADGGTRLRAVQQMQGEQGNAYVQRMVGALRVQREVARAAASNGSAAQAPASPSDVNIGFNPMDIMHKLLIAIDQSDVQVKWGDRPEDLKRHIDFPAVVSALNNLTANEVKQVEDLYAQHEKGRTLSEDIFGMGESSHRSDLTEDQRIRISALLRGTRVEGGGKSEAALDAQAAELHELLRGDLDKEDIEHVMTMLRRSAAANAELAKAYEHQYNIALSADLARMGPAYLIRAFHLLAGRISEADKIVIGGARLRIEEIDKEIEELKEKQKEYGKYSIGVSSYNPYYWQIDELKKERKKLVDEIEQRTQQTVDEARAEALHQGGDEAAAEGAARARATAVLGDVNAVAASVAGKDTDGKNADAAMIRAIASDDPVAKAAADLRKASRDDKLDGAMLTAILRDLRDEAEVRAKYELPKGDPGIAARAQTLASDYYSQLRTAYNALAGDTKQLDALVADTGNEGDVALNQKLIQGGGILSDVDELVMALSGDRKDTATVERVLKYKSAFEIKLLKNEYFMRTGGRSLDYELFGEAPTDAGEENPEVAGVHLKAQGKAEGTSRLNLEDYMQRPEQEGGLAEAHYIAARAEREYDFTIENRGATGWWRDKWGNEQRALLDETIKEVRRLHDQYFYDAVANPRWPHSAEAHDILQQLRLARATIRGDRAAYEKATAELRATFQAIAAFALQAALTAVIGPIAEFALIGELAEGASAALRVAKTVQTAAVGTSATIGANLAVYGSDYSLDMLKADLKGGMLGAIGPAAVEKMVGPYAKALASKLGPKASAELIEAAKTAAGIVTGGGELNPDEFAKALVMNKAGAAITQKVGSGLGLTPKPGATHGAPEATPTTHDITPVSETAPAAVGAPTEAAPTQAKAAAVSATSSIEPTAPSELQLVGTKTTMQGEAPVVVKQPVPSEAATPASAESAPSATTKMREPSEIAKSPPREEVTQPGTATFDEEVTQTHARAAALPRELPVLEIHPDMPNVMIEAGIPGFDMDALLAEMARTPQGERVADRIRSGDVEVTITREPLAGGAQGLGDNREIQITWGGSVEETVGTFLHEGTHNLDPFILQAGDQIVRSSTLSLEATAREHEYEYRMARGLPPYDAAEAAYRSAREAAVNSGASEAEANLAAGRAMIEAMRANPERYAVETPAQEKAAIEARRQRPIEVEPTPSEFLPPESDFERELFGDLNQAETTQTGMPAFEDEVTQPDIRLPQEPSTPLRAPGREPAGAGTPGQRGVPTAAQPEEPTARAEDTQSAVEAGNDQDPAQAAAQVASQPAGTTSGPGESARPRVLKRVQPVLDLATQLKRQTYKLADARGGSEDPELVRIAGQCEEIERRLKAGEKDHAIVEAYRQALERNGRELSRMALEASSSHPSKYAIGDRESARLRNANDIRTRFYKGNYRESSLDAVFNAARSGQQNAAGQELYQCQNTGPVIGPNHKPLVTYAEATVEHRFNVAEHWNTIGRNTTQEERNTFYDDPADLVVFCPSCNFAQPKARYEPEVGSNFRGPDDRPLDDDH